MQILQLCKKYPFPPKDGETVAILNLAVALHNLGATVDLLAMNTLRHESRVNGQAHYSFYREVETVPVDNQIKILPAFLNLFSHKSYHIERFESADFSLKLKEMLLNTAYDVVQLETLYLATYIPVIRKYSKAKIALRAHNVEFEIWERIVNNSSPNPKYWYLNYLAKKLKNYECHQLSQYDLLAAISQRDWEKYRELGYKGPGLVVPIGFNPKAYRPVYPDYRDVLSIGFIGSLDWLPNLRGMEWFLADIWPGIHAKYPKLELHIAGRNTPAWLLQLEKKNIIVHGEVDDAQAFIKKHNIALVPLRSGSGMRVKILEAMALGKVVLTTSLGLEGILARDGQEVLIADNYNEFIAKIHHCQVAPDRLSLIGQNARSLVERHYDRERIAEKLLAAYQQIVSL